VADLPADPDPVRAPAPARRRDRPPDRESTFWQLEPGVNIVTFSAPSGSVEVTIEYASRYTGV